jgi:glycine/D-amino acid oxidase-like deaminating enzyme
MFGSCKWVKVAKHNGNAARFCHNRAVIRRSFRYTAFTALAQENPEAPREEDIRRVGIVGGGMAGLSVAYHLLKLQPTSGVSITILDSASLPGSGGASSKAGGLLHPLSPRGDKMVHLGEEALKIANQIIDDCFMDNDDDVITNNNFILRNEIYRIAATEDGGKILQQSAIKYPHIATWLARDEIHERIFNKAKTSISPEQSQIFGGIVLTNGCKVLHVPTYLQTLWKKCQKLSSLKAPIHWKHIPAESSPSWQKILLTFDTIVYASGSGMFLHQDTLEEMTASLQFEPMISLPTLPISLVRGQSIELNFPANHDQQWQDLPPILCGKYLCPLPAHSHDTIIGDNNRQSGRVMIGATVEHYNFQLNQSTNLRTTEYAKENLQQLSLSFVPPELWSESKFKFTSGWRVQSKRTQYGRLPIVGKLYENEHIARGHQDAWIFTGLSSRGLLYHGIFGKILSEAIINKCDNKMLQMYPELSWWRV